MTMLTPRPQRRFIFLGLGMVAAVATLAMAGAVLALGSLGNTDDDHAQQFPAPAGEQPKKSVFRVAEDIPTTFGAMSVKHAERLNGLTPSDLGGMAMGTRGLVTKDKMLLQASVTLTNLLDRTVRYTPGAFTLRTEKDGKPIKLSSASVVPGELQPDASIDARIDFTAPRGAKRFWLDYTDPGRAKRLTIDLGVVKALRGGGQASKNSQAALRSTAGQTMPMPDGHGK